MQRLEVKKDKGFVFVLTSLLQSLA